MSDPTRGARPPLTIAEAPTAPATRPIPPAIASVLEQMSDGFVTLDFSWKYVYANRVAGQLLGRAPQELIGQNIWTLFPDAVGNAFHRAYQRAMNERVPVSIEEHYERWGRWFENRVYPTSEGIAIFFSEITERKNFEEALRRAQKMDAIGRLAGSVAHDFNNILTAIIGFAELASGSVPPSNPVSHDIAEIRRAAERASALTRQLLAFSRQQPTAPVVTAINDVASRVGPMLERLLGAGTTLAMALAPDAGNAQVDPAQLEQAIVNLVVNARDAMPDGGLVTLETGSAELGLVADEVGSVVRPGRYSLLAVTDTGTGMTPSVRAKMFEPFFTTKATSQGTGLGLATVYGFVRDAGGHLFVDSSPGRGTTVRMYLPCSSDAATAEPQRPAAPRVPLAARRQTVLVVDDESMIRALVRRILEKHGYTVHEAKSGDDALWVWKREGDTIDVLLTDLVMPGMDGRELARRFLAEHPRTRVLHMSGYTDRGPAEGGVLPRLEDGAVLLRKPFTTDQLLAAVNGTSVTTAG